MTADVDKRPKNIEEIFSNDAIFGEWKKFHKIN